MILDIDKRRYRCHIDFGQYRLPMRGPSTMLEIYRRNGPVAIDASDPRNQFHERALHEAQAASEWRGWVDPTVDRRARLLARVRSAFAGASRAAASEPCTCPA
jgi:hypothetical protein